MSAGRFSRSFYQTNAGVTHPIRVQPETISEGWNPPPAGPADSQISAIANGRRRRLGVNARRIRIAFEDTAPVGYLLNSPIALPILDQDAWEALTKNDEIPYLGQTATVLGKTPEYIN